MAGELDGRRVAILAADGVERVELEQPRQALEDAGADTDIVSPSNASRTGSPATSSWPSTLVDSYVVPSRFAIAVTGVLDGVGVVVGVALSPLSSPSSDEPQPASRPTSRRAVTTPSRAAPIRTRPRLG